MMIYDFYKKYILKTKILGEKKLSMSCSLSFSFIQ